MNLMGLLGVPVFRTEMALYGDYSSGTRGKRSTEGKKFNFEASTGLTEEGG